MKISTLVQMLLIVSVVFFVVLSMVHEGEQNYNTDINDTDWTGQYDYVQDVNDSIAPIQKSITTIEQGQAGFLDIVTEGFTGIVAAITLFPRMLFSTASIGSSLILGLGSTLGIPSYIMLALIVSLLAWGVFKLVGILQKEDL